MPEYAPGVLRRQVAALPADLRALAGPVGEQAAAALTTDEWRAAGTVFLTGSGDSFAAAVAAEAAFRRRLRVTARAVSTQPMLDPDVLALTPGRPVVVGCSASGRTERVVDALTVARAAGALTVAVTGRAASPVTLAAERSVVTDIGDDEPSPGMRTYHATLLALLLLALRGDTGEIVAIADVVETTTASVATACESLAAELAGAPLLHVVGGGPSRGTAMFAAAKIVEGTGTPALADDPEEWWHVGRFARPFDAPLVVVAPPGRDHARAAELVQQAGQLGRRVVAVHAADDHALASGAWRSLPVAGAVAEDLTPLAYGVFAGLLAHSLGERLGRTPFTSSGP